MRELLSMSHLTLSSLYFRIRLSLSDLFAPFAKGDESPTWFSLALVWRNLSKIWQHSNG